MQIPEDAFCFEQTGGEVVTTRYGQIVGRHSDLCSALDAAMWIMERERSYSDLIELATDGRWWFVDAEGVAVEVIDPDPCSSLDGCTCAVCCAMSEVCEISQSRQ